MVPMKPNPSPKARWRGIFSFNSKTAIKEANRGAVKLSAETSAIGVITIAEKNISMFTEFKTPRSP